MGDLSCRVPCRTRCEFGLFQENHVRAALGDESVGKTGSHDAAADNDDACGFGDGGGHRWRLGHSRESARIMES